MYGSDRLQDWFVRVHETAIVTEYPRQSVRKAKGVQEQMQCQGPNCTREIEQIPGSHRQRIYCSDRCRIAASRLRIRGMEQEQTQNEAHTRKEREKVARTFGLLTEESLNLLVDLYKRDTKLALMVGQALARERDQGTC